MAKCLLILSLQWRHNGRDGVSNHQPRDCLLNHLFGCRSKKTSKLRLTGLCAGNSLGTGEFPAQMASNAENVSIWWRHPGGRMQWWGVRCHSFWVCQQEVPFYKTPKYSYWRFPEQSSHLSVTPVIRYCIYSSAAVTSSIEGTLTIYCECICIYIYIYIYRILSSIRDIPAVSIFKKIDCYKLP